jgi:hypothetical protein
MREESISLRGAPVRSLPRPNRTYARGRVCAEEGCGTVISIYNRSRYCWLHEPLRYHALKGRKKRAA